MLSFLPLVSYNRLRSLISYDSAIDGAVLEVPGAKSAGEPVLLFVCGAPQGTFGDADRNGGCGRTSEAAGREPACRQDNFF